MPLAGGAADKAGNRYECKWVVRQFIRILAGEASWIHLEPPGTAGASIEFRLQMSDGSFQVHQVKRQNGAKGVWTIRDLARAGILDAVYRHTLEGGQDFHFVSTDSVKSLRELAERARSAESLHDFQKHHLSLSEVGEFDAFCSKLVPVDCQTSLEALRRFHPTAIAESILSDEISAHLASLVDGDGETARDVLAAWALENIHKRIIAPDIWAELARHGFQPSSLAYDRSLAARIEQCTDDYLQSQSTDIAGLNVPRAVTEKVVSCFTDLKKRTVFLLGGAGAGKTAVSGQIVTALRNQSWPILAFRMDRLDRTVRQDEVGRQLLGRIASPVAMLASVAQGRSCLLVIEQLDAVSTVSGRSPEAFQCVADMVREARAHRSMRVLLVCREFDLENDQRIRDLQNSERDRCEVQKVEPFTPDEVKNALAHLGVDDKRLDARQLELLRLPLHLAVLAGIRAERPGEPIQFTTSKDLFDAYWRVKQTSVLPLLSNANHFRIILGALCDEMTKRQTLAVPRGVVLAWENDVQKLVSSGLLTEHSGRIAFFHESFFDYVFARNFCDSGRALIDFVTSGDQDLFIRGQVRQVLTYGRDQSFNAYLKDVASCIRLPGVRFHLKKIVIAVIGQVRNPTQEEWEFLAACLGDTAPGYANAARMALWPSAAWFRFLYCNGSLAAWLSSPDESLVNFALNYIGHMAAQEPQRAVELLRPSIQLSATTDLRVLNLFSWNHEATVHAEVEALLFDILSNPNRDWQFRKSAFSTIHAHNGPENAQIAARAVGLFLDLLSETSEVSLADSEIYSTFPEHELMEIAEKAPAHMARAVVPSLLKLMDHYADKENGEAPWSDTVWHGCSSNLDHWTPGLLLYYTASALKCLAANAPNEYAHLIGLLTQAPFRIAQAISLHALAVQREDVKEIGVRWLTQTWLRQEIWSHEVAIWDARELLKALASLLTAEDVEQMEPLILGQWEKWHPVRALWESEEEERRYRRPRMNHHMERLGWCQYQLLGVLPINHLSHSGRRRRQELERKFVGRKLERPMSIHGGWVTSPIRASSVKMMSDSQWLSAINRYDRDDEKEWLPDAVIGGAEQLAHLLDEETKLAPERFARLALRFPAEANVHYFDAIAMGLANAELPPDVLGSVAHLLHGRPNRPHGCWLPRLIARNGAQPLPNDLLEIVSWYAVSDPDPVSDIWREERASGPKLYDGNAYFHGINTARGETALAIASLVSIDGRYWEYFQSTIETLVSDKTIAVRSCVARICSQVLRYDRKRAIVLFHRLVDTDDVILGQDSVEEFVHYTAAHDWPSMQPVLERMMASREDKARKVGARQGTLASLSQSEAEYLADRALIGDAALRRGAADVLSYNAPQHPDFCISRLAELFNDAEKTVRETASNWIGRVDDHGTLDKLLPLANAYLNSAAFTDHPDNFFWMIERVTDAPPALLFDAADRFLDFAGRDSVDIQSAYAHAGDLVGKLVLRAYRQAETDRGLRLRCLDLFDRLIAYGTYGAEQALGSWEA